MKEMQQRPAFLALLAFCISSSSSSWTLVYAFMPSTTHFGGRPKKIVSTTRLLSTLSTKTKSEPMPWTLNVEEYGKFDMDAQDVYWRWAWTSVTDDACASYDCDDDNIEGEVPRDLVGGTFYRVGPGNFERGGQRYNHNLDGDGFLVAFRFDENGKVRYTGRFIETEFFLKEKEKDEILYRNVFGTQRKGGMLTNAFDLKFKNVANTNVVQWGGRLFVLWEAGRPYELDKETLKVLDASEDGPFRNLGIMDSMRGITLDEGGPMDKAANLGRSFTAHPHIVDDNTLVAFKVAQNPLSKNLMMEIIEFDKEWREKKRINYSFPDTPSASHDFCISDDYYCFFENRIDVDTTPFLLGQKGPAQIMQCRLDEPNILHLVPRSQDNKKAIQVEIPSYFTIHNVPKVEQVGSKLTIYSNGWNLKDERYFPCGQESVPFLGSWGGTYPDFVGMTAPPALLYRTVIDLESSGGGGQLVSHQEVLPGLVMEFPTQDERDPNQIYVAVSDTNYTSLPGAGIVKIDVKKDSATYWWAEPRTFTGEASPVPKRNGEAGSWLITVLYDASNQRASLAILDSERLEDGPVCRIHLPHALAYSLHGSFVPSG